MHGVSISTGIPIVNANGVLARYSLPAARMCTLDEECHEKPDNAGNHCLLNWASEICRFPATGVPGARSVQTREYRVAGEQE